ncbi:transposase [Microbispora sp. NPDC046973]|uniref:transposase n=1 Tax=Microbispora sp. NPDC046973 TaxID=3155022 RepID=UPI0033D50315
MLAEFGDDPHRYVSAKARKNYTGTSPITRASGRKKVVAAGYVHNDRLIDALIAQAATAIRISPGARAYYDKQRGRDAGYNAPSVKSPTVWSASCTAASRPAPRTTKQPLGLLNRNLLPLDT